MLVTVPKSSSVAGGASKPADPSGEDGAKVLRVDARRNRERILEAAREAFAADGLAVPLDEIARCAGVGAGTVYRHFPTKEALFEAVVLGRLQDLVEETRSLQDAEDSGGAFFGFLSRMVAEMVAKKDLIEALAGAGIDLDSGGSQITRDLRDASADLLSRAQRASAVRGDIGVADVMALLTGASLAIRQHGGDSGAADRIVAVVKRWPSPRSLVISGATTRQVKARLVRAGKAELRDALLTLKC